MALTCRGYQSKCTFDRIPLKKERVVVFSFSSRKRSVAIAAMRQGVLFSVILLALTTARGADLSDPNNERGENTESYQNDADIVRLNDLKVLGGLVDEFHDKTGRYPFQGRSEAPICVYIAIPEQEQAIFHDQGSANDRVERSHLILPVTEFSRELESALERSIEIPFDPQQMHGKKPNYYIYRIDGETFFTTVHTHNPFRFTRKVGLHYYKVEIGNSPYPEQRLWDYQTLMENPDFVSACTKPMVMPDYFKKIRDSQNKEFDRIRSQAQQAEAMLAFDSFDEHLSLDWDILNAIPSHWSLLKHPGMLTIVTQDGTFTRNRTDYKNVFLIDCPTLIGQDFQITTCLVSFEPRQLWNQAGLILWNDANNYLKLVYEWGEGPPTLNLEHQCMITAAVEMEGRAFHAWYHADQQMEKVWLRVTKRMNCYELFASADGKIFTPLKSMPYVFGPTNNVMRWGNGVVRRLGIFASNGSARNSAQVDAPFDFFEVKTPPEKEGTTLPGEKRLALVD